MAAAGRMVHCENGIHGGKGQQLMSVGSSVSASSIMTRHAGM